jgi:uncharacterized protein YrzB (UPF0473 family)
MSNGYGGDYVTITDEDGNDYELEYLDTIDAAGSTYMAFLPADTDEDDEDYGTVIFKVVEVDGEDMLASVDDDEELNFAYERFMEQIFSEEDDKLEENGADG